MLHVFKGIGKGWVKAPWWFKLNHAWGLLVVGGRLECSCTLWKRAVEEQFPVAC